MLVLISYREAAVLKSAVLFILKIIYFSREKLNILRIFVVKIILKFLTMEKDTFKRSNHINLIDCVFSLYNEMLGKFDHSV